jgi:hypothetical protein
MGGRVVGATMAKAPIGKRGGIRGISLDALVNLVAKEIGESKDEVRRYVVNNMRRATGRSTKAAGLKKHCAKPHP